MDDMDKFVYVCVESGIYWVVRERFLVSGRDFRVRLHTLDSLRDKCGDPYRYTGAVGSYVR